MFGLKDLIDILLVAALMFGVFRLLRTSGAGNLFWGILAYVGIWFLVSFVFRLEMTGAVFNFIGSAGAVALVVIFQEEIRAFFNQVGAHLSNAQRFVNMRIHPQAGGMSEQQIEQVVTACTNMATTKTGALIIVQRNLPLDEFEQTGEQVQAAISSRMIENIFFKNSPLHDGALIIRDGQLESAACILPVSRNQSIPKHYGLRHRAALGLAEKSDALAIVVSEETGKVSIAENGRIRTIRLQELSDIIKNTPITSSKIENTKTN